MTQLFKTILYATDLSETSKPAFNMALSLAKEYQANLLFLHVVEPLSASAASAVNVYMPGGTIQELYKQSLAEMHKNVDAKMRSLYKEAVAEDLDSDELQTYVVDGVPAPTILKTAEKMDVDLIVLGSHTHNTLENIFIGSVANKVLQRSTRPVLLVPIDKD